MMLFTMTGPDDGPGRRAWMTGPDDEIARSQALAILAAS